MKTRFFITKPSLITFLIAAAFISYFLVNLNNSKPSTSIDYETPISRLELLVQKFLTEANKRLSKLEEEKNSVLNYNKDTKISYLKIYEFGEQIRNETFDCVKSASIVVQTTICIHDLTHDVFVSKSIKQSGVWERDLVSLFMKFLLMNPDFQVFDIGAQLGQYTLYAAKLGRKCISVEPFYDNYIRLEKSAMIENLTDKIILINNGISDKRGQRKRLHISDQNIGGQAINDKDVTSINLNDKYELVTIHMDDLVSIVPEDFKHAIMKIDIEGYEFKAFIHAKKLLLKVNVPIIFMEWLGKSDVKLFPDRDVNEFLDFMQLAGYTSRSVNQNFAQLNRSTARNWPGDILWVKNDYYPKMIELYELKVKQQII